MSGSNSILVHRFHLALPIFIRPCFRAPSLISPFFTSLIYFIFFLYSHSLCHIGLSRAVIFILLSFLLWAPTPHLQSFATLFSFLLLSIFPLFICHSFLPCFCRYYLISFVSLFLPCFSRYLLPSIATLFTSLILSISPRFICHSLFLSASLDRSPLHLPPFLLLSMSPPFNCYTLFASLNDSSLHLPLSSLTCFSRYLLPSFATHFALLDIYSLHLPVTFLSASLDIYSFYLPLFFSTLFLSISHLFIRHYLFFSHSFDISSIHLTISFSLLPSISPHFICYSLFFSDSLDISSLHLPHSFLPCFSGYPPTSFVTLSFHPYFSRSPLLLFSVSFLLFFFGDFFH
ncbi:unnamed protein product [Acanthosepion pharaonis]|uniref:Uncharacterized protein n=1 Tax=Acanthosepion pharaonis TaxID=158019 RepID=A0A812BTL7_ACAPH|nr:unnamed protein product [Sepia pharaonis]